MKGEIQQCLRTVEIEIDTDIEASHLYPLFSRVLSQSVRLSRSLRVRLFKTDPFETTELELIDPKLRTIRG